MELERRRGPLRRARPAAALLLAACNLAEPLVESDGAGADAGEVDGGLEGGDRRDGAEGEGGDPAPDGPRGFDAAATGGPLTLVGSQAFVAADRLCDLDGDGLADNAVANLGDPGAALFAAALTNVVQGEIDSGDMRFVFHLPWVEQLAGRNDPEVLLISFEGDDTDDGGDDPTDDFSGEEPFYVHSASLDPCGEPRFFLTSASMVDGELRASQGSVVMPFHAEIPGRGAQVSGSIEIGSLRADLEVCMYLSVRDLGGAAGIRETDEHTMLEAMLLGGAAIGVATFGGLTPDIDLDGDGLERFVLDDSDHLVSCIDGDGSEISGSGCWDDERMADAFSMTFRVSTVAARLAGPEPGWEEAIDGTCDEPPAESLWDAR